MYLSIIIPAYNEEKRITKTLLDINQYLRGCSFDYEIIVVSDGSTDKTIQIVENLKNNIKNLKIISNAENRGKGYVVRQGFLQAQGQYRLFVDADNSTPITELDNFLTFLPKYDVVIGSRSAQGSKIISKQTFYRVILGDFFNFIAQSIIGLYGIKDTQCGFKLISSKAAEDILPRCMVNGWSFDVELLILAKKLGYKIKETPIAWTNDSASKIKLKGMFFALVDLFKIKLNLLLNKY